MKKLSMDELGRISPEAYKHKDKSPFVIVLDNVRSLHNVGSAFRTADAFMAEKIYLCGITGCPPHREIQKTALGATESVDWEYCPETGALADRLLAEGYALVAVEQAEEATMLDAFLPDPAKKYAFIFGNEVSGVSDEAMEKCSMALEIPQSGTKHSLNVSVAVGVVLWEFVRRKLIVNY